jgi:uncharacterized protein YndB with AHSA1/START domain
MHNHLLRKEGSMPDETADPRVSVIVPALPAEAFRVFTEHPDEWLPPAHTFIPGAESVAMEPWAGGRFYERSAGGTEVTRGTVVDWAPPARLAVTWRIGPGWKPIDNDEHASVIVAEFSPAGTDATEVTLTYTHLERHGGEMAEMIRAAVGAAGQGSTLERYAEAVARRVDPAEGRTAAG